MQIIEKFGSKIDDNWWDNIDKCVYNNSIPNRTNSMILCNSLLYKCEI